VFRIRSVVQEFEVALAATPTCLGTKARGRAECKTYGDGSRRIKASLSRLQL